MDSLRTVARGSALPEVLRQVRDASCTSLINHCSKMLTSCDDVYFDLAEKARNNSEQNMYFEAMREVRLKKDSVLARFHKGLRANFDDLALIAKPQHSSVAAASTMNLLQSDELEANVAIDSMATRSRLDCQEQLYNIIRRLDFLLSHQTINDQNNPLDPKSIGHAFKHACEIIEAPIGARIVLFKHFERVVGREFHTIIGTANQQLINAGVLPKVGHAVRKNRNTPSSPQSSKVQAARVAEHNGPSNAALSHQFSKQFQELSDLLTGVRELALAGNLGFPLFLSNGSGPALNGDELSDMLTELQSQQRDTRDGESLLTPQLDLRSLLTSGLAQRGERGEKTRIERTDEDVINLIAMFFDFVLDDKQLPIQIQALISRLQIPILKVALGDRKFFSASSHPARKLINEIVSIGVGVDDSDTRSASGLFDKIASVVGDIHDNYSEGDAVFQSGVDALQTWRKAEEKRIARVEKRTSEAAAAEAKTRHTKAMIEAMILEKLEVVKAPTLVQDFAIDHWQQVLFLARLKHGEESQEWIDAQQTLDDIIWSSLKHDDQKSMARLQRILPDLQTKTRALLNTAAASSEDAEATLDELFKLQTALLEDGDKHSISRSELAEDQRVALKKTERIEKPWKEMTAVERQQVQYQALTYDYIKKVEDLPLGTWILFSRTPSTQAIRCKLASRIESSDSYVFVNRMGFKILEKKRKEFAYNLQESRASIVQHELFFDRVMNRVTSRLHKHTQTISRDSLPA